MRCTQRQEEEYLGKTVRVSYTLLRDIAPLLPPTTPGYILPSHHTWVYPSRVSPLGISLPGITSGYILPCTPPGYISPAVHNLGDTSPATPRLMSPCCYTTVDVPPAVLHVCDTSPAVPHGLMSLLLFLTCLRASLADCFNRVLKAFLTFLQF